MTDEQKGALDEIAKAAVHAESLTGCPALLMAAQCILETGWLRNAPGNNCMGIKEYNGAHGRQLLSTVEWLTEKEVDWFLRKGEGRTATLDENILARPDGRRRYAVRDWFATFACLGDCLAKRAAMWNRGSYAASAEQYAKDGDVLALARRISGVYATDPHYADSLVSLMESGGIKAAVSAESKHGS